MDVNSELASSTALKKGQISRVFLIADAGTRTPDPFITSEVLYQLSYVGDLAGQCTGVLGASRARLARRRLLRDGQDLSTGGSRTARRAARARRCAHATRRRGSPTARGRATGHRS